MATPDISYLEDVMPSPVNSQIVSSTNFIGKNSSLSDDTSSDNTSTPAEASTASFLPWGGPTTATATASSAASLLTRGFTAEHNDGEPYRVEILFPLSSEDPFSDIRRSMALTSALEGMHSSDTVGNGAGNVHEW